MSDGRARGDGARAVAWGLGALTAAVVGWPAAAIAWRVGGALARGEVRGGMWVPSGALLASTGVWALGIGVVATVLGWPAAWWIGRRGWGVAPLALTPLLLPNYLAYAGYGLLRAPGTAVGDWIEWAATNGAAWMPIFAGRVVAVAGLGLWASPLAAVALGAAFRGVDGGVLDALRMEGMGRARRGAFVAWMCRGGVMGAVGVVALVMLGSAVPLQLAQAPAYAIVVWLELTLAPGSAGVWVSAWPLLAVAVLAGWWLARRAAACERGAEGEDERSARLAGVGAAGVWALAVVLPLGLFVMSVHDWRSVARFWSLWEEAISASAWVAAAVGAASAGLVVATWIAASGRHGWTAAWCLRAWLAAALTPGVLVGTAVAGAWEASATTRAWMETPWVLVAAHLARFGGVAVLAGVLLARIERPEARRLRALDGAVGVRGWWWACAPVHGGVIAGVGVAAAALSLHEIEASVILQPPGQESLARTLLGFLHFSRMEDLSAAAINLVGVGLVGAVVAAWALRAALAPGRRGSAASGAERLR